MSHRHTIRWSVRSGPTHTATVPHWFAVLLTLAALAWHRLSPDRTTLEIR